MSLTSMTGFARADGEHRGVRWHWEVKSVNGKSLDIRCRFPAGFEPLEQKAREVIPEFVRRGNCQIALQVQRDTDGGGISINEAALDLVITAVENVRQRTGVGPATAEGILALKGVIENTDSSDLRPDQGLLEEMSASLGAALGELVAYREAEGAQLASVIAEHVAGIERLTEEADKTAALRPESIRARIAEQVARLMDGAPSLDEDRLHQEAVLIATRVDVREEIDRLRAHAQAARALLKSKGPAGRKFDFLVQEFNREANTLCSKASDSALTNIGLELKAVIDQMREQVQNIE